MVNDAYILKVSKEISISTQQIKATIDLLDGGATVPFLSRYRKEVTGSLDEVQIASIRDRISQLRELDKRRATVLESIEKQGKLTEELKKQILKAQTLAQLEDLYLPYKPKRRTRGTVAKEKGLEPLAKKIWLQDDSDPFKEAEKFVNPEKKVANVEEALAGARDIMAEWINEDSYARAKMRELFFEEGMIKSKVIKNKEKDAVKYKDYFDWQETVSKAPSHRILAMRRGEKELFLSLRIAPVQEDALDILAKIFVKATNESAKQMRTAMEDSYRRLLSPSMETEIRVETKKRADEKAIKVFTQNLRQLLMAPPLGQKNVLALDPGYRTGCKVVCLNRQGRLLYNGAIYITQSDRALNEARESIAKLCKEYEIEAVAIGNGTASRETEEFIRGLNLSPEVLIIMVSENGASVYSASEVAREEFPKEDVTVRGAISIGRRLMDPLAELVKIDPKSIGVGQYQHDVDQKLLKQSLDDTVISCVNLVGVEVNTASKQILMYVSGLGPLLAQTIIDYRNEKGPFKYREEFQKVPRFGPKVFEQAAGFLRIREGKNPLDASSVHPESYGIVHKIVEDLKCSVQDLMNKEDLREKIDLHQYITDKVGLPTLMDIKNELAKPGRDPRKQFEEFRFEEGIQKPEDLKLGMKLPGIVTNVTAFGVFVDIGVHLDGLVHISQLSNKFIKNPADIIKVHQKVMVTVLDVDFERKRIALSMREDEGKVSKVEPVGKDIASETKKRHERKKPKKLSKKETQPFINNPFKSLKLESNKEKAGGNA